MIVQVADTPPMVAHREIDVLEHSVRGEVREVRCVWEAIDQNLPRSGITNHYRLNYVAPAPQIHRIAR